VCVFQRVELAALRAKREEEEEMKRVQTKRDKLCVAFLLLLRYLLICHLLSDVVLY